MIETGWVPEELPASQHLRTVAEILAERPTSREERDAARRERAEQEASQARALDTADSVAAAQFRARMRGEAPRTAADVLAAATAGDGPEREEHARRRSAIEILKRYDLQDVITGGRSGCVIDPDVGILEPLQDESARADMDRRYEFERSQREAEERTRIVARAKAQLDERWRARGLGGAEQSRVTSERHVSFR